METTISERLNQIAEHYGLTSYAAFADYTGIGHQTVSNYLKGKQKPDADRLTMILQSFDKVSARWLVTGEGKMLDKEKSPEGLEGNLGEIYRALTHIVTELGELKEDVSKINVKND